MLTDLVPLRHRGTWGGIIGGMWSVGSVCGPIIGGAFAQVQWRWIFWLNLPFIGIALVIVPMALRLTIKPSTKREKVRQFDWIGSAVFTASATSVLIPLTWGGTQYAWGSWRTLVPLVLGLVGILAFALYEKYVATEPLMRLSLFENQTSCIAFFTTTIHGLILWCVLFYLPLYFEAVQGYRPVLSGVAMLPDMLTIAPIAVITGQFITRYNSYYWTIWAGWLVTTLGLGLLVMLDVQTKLQQWLFICLVSGIGLGILLPALLFELQAASRNEDMAFAVATFIFFRSLGQCIGVATGSVIFQNQMLQKLREDPRFAPRANELARDAAALVETIQNLGSEADKVALRTAYAKSVSVVWIVMCALSGLCLTLTFFVKAYDINIGLETEQGLIEDRGSKKSKPQVSQALSPKERLMSMPP